MIHGLIVVNKTKNISSHSVVERIRKIFKTKKVGHFGTLDPFAEGVLLIGMGNTTKFFNFYIKKKKLYAGIIKFGFATTTYDIEGVPISEKKEVDLYKIDIDTILSDFSGKILQKPPIYSAKKFKGKPFYKYARENKSLDVKPIEVEIYSIRGKVINKDILWFEALTSSGTYMRSLANDIGIKVGVGAYLEELKRERIGEFDLKRAVSVEELTVSSDISNLVKYVIPIETLLPEFPKIIVTQSGRRAVLNGMPLFIEGIIKILPAEDDTNFRLFDEEGKLLAIARKESKKVGFKPYIVFPS